MTPKRLIPRHCLSPIKMVLFTDPYLERNEKGQIKKRQLFLHS